MKIEVFETLNSTHLYLKKNYKKYDNQTVIIANSQTGGIGTRGRNWYTGSKDNIAVSFLYKENLNLDSFQGLTIKIAEVIKKSIKEIYNINLEIKYPNDLLLNSKKICGILTEIHTSGNEINYLIISFGLNVNEVNFPKEIENEATSLKKEFHKEFDKEKILEVCIEEINKLIYGK